MATVSKRGSAKRLGEGYVYLAEHAGIETAERFLSRADESFSDLDRHPGMGTALSPARSEADGVAQMAGQRI